MGATHIFKMQVLGQPDGSTLYQFKAWNAVDPEPAGWLLSDPDFGDLPSGSLLLVAHHVRAHFGTITITPLP